MAKPNAEEIGLFIAALEAEPLSSFNPDCPTSSPMFVHKISNRTWTSSRYESSSLSSSGGHVAILVTVLEPNQAPSDSNNKLSITVCYDETGGFTKDRLPGLLLKKLVIRALEKIRATGVRMGAVHPIDAGVGAIWNASA